MNDLSGKVIRVVDTNHSIFMTEQESRSIYQMKFKNHVSYKVIKNLTASFWKNVHDSWYKDISKDANKSYDLINHQKGPISKRAKSNNTTSNIKKFHARFRVLSALRSAIKLKIWSCSHRHYSKRTVHRGLMIKVIIPEDCFIMFNCGLVHCGTPSWFINRDEYGKSTRAFFTIVERDFFLTHEITVQKKICFVILIHVIYVSIINLQQI